MNTDEKLVNKKKIVKIYDFMKNILIILKEYYLVIQNHQAKD